MPLIKKLNFKTLGKLVKKYGEKWDKIGFEMGNY